MRRLETVIHVAKRQAGRQRQDRQSDRQLPSSDPEKGEVFGTFSMASWGNIQFPDIFTRKIPERQTVTDRQSCYFPGPTERWNPCPNSNTLGNIHTLNTFMWQSYKQSCYFAGPTKKWNPCPNTVTDWGISRCQISRCYRQSCYLPVTNRKMKPLS